MSRTAAAPHIVEFLRAANPCVIASNRPDGQPVSVATWYLLEDDGRILVNMDGGRRRLSYLRDDPRVTLTVLAGADWYTHVSVQGRIVEISVRCRPGRHRPDLHPLHRQRLPDPGSRAGQRLDRHRLLARVAHQGTLTARRSMNWRDTDLTRRLGIRLPIVQAPMAGGWTPPALVAAVSEAGGLGSLAGAMLTPDELREQIRAIRALTGKPFAVNLFAPLPAPSERGLDRVGALTGVPAPDADGRPATLRRPTVGRHRRAGSGPQLHLRHPPVGRLRRLHHRHRDDGRRGGGAGRAGVDAVVAQGFEAGGHRGTFLAPLTGGGSRSP